MKDLTEHLKKAKARVLHKNKIKFNVSNEEECLAAVEIDGSNIENIPNPSEAVQLKAVNQEIWNVKYIMYPTEKVQLVAIGVSGIGIGFIKKPSEMVQLKAVSIDGDVLGQIAHPTERVIIEAIRQDKRAIQYVHIDCLSEETKEVLMYLV